MADYIDKAVVNKMLFDFILELSRTNAGREAYAVSKALAMVQHIPVADVRENTIRTQADRIRAGSNEHIAGVVCTGCPLGMETGKQCTEDGACYDCWLDWLKSPIRGDEDGSQ